MKDLQELFESLGADDFNKLAETVDKKSLNPATLKKVLDYISIVYCAEKKVKEAELSREKMEKLIESFNLGMILYKNILDGHMEIISGRLKLTDDKNCNFRLTKEGLAYVENMIKK